MFRLTVVTAFLTIGASPALAQSPKKTNPLIAVPQLRIGQVQPTATAQRTIEVLRAAGIMNVRPDAPFTLSARQPYIDPQTFLILKRVSIQPERNAILMNDASMGLEGSVAKIQWFGNLDRRYVVDCSFGSGAGSVQFEWSVPLSSDPPPNHADVPIIDGRAAVVLPAAVASSVILTTRQSVELSSCDVTPFGP